MGGGWGGFVKQPLCKATEFVLKLLAQLSAILFAFARAWAVLVVGCPIVFARHNIAHTRIFTRLFGA